MFFLVLFYDEDLISNKHNASSSCEHCPDNPDKAYETTSVIMFDTQVINKCLITRIYKAMSCSRVLYTVLDSTHWKCTYSLVEKDSRNRNLAIMHQIKSGIKAVVKYLMLFSAIIALCSGHSRLCSPSRCRTQSQMITQRKGNNGFVLLSGRKGMVWSRFVLQ